jgi:hypothetical protein
MCPNCKGNKINHQKDFGCAFLIFLFISMGIGLIMIPFLPTKHTCRDCGTQWN